MAAKIAAIARTLDTLRLLCTTQAQSYLFSSPENVTKTNAFSLLLNSLWLMLGAVVSYQGHRISPVFFAFFSLHS